MPRYFRPDFPPPNLITTTAALAAFCQRMHAETFVAVDTEFMRERTYWPELCLVQIAGEKEVAVIDAMADGIDLAPLGALFADQAVTKVFHAARQDIEIFVMRYGDVPTANVRHAGRRNGRRIWRSGRLRCVGFCADRRQHRQGASLQRLVGAPALGRADYLCRRRRDPSAGSLYPA